MTGAILSHSLPAQSGARLYSFLQHFYTLAHPRGQRRLIVGNRQVSSAKQPLAKQKMPHRRSGIFIYIYIFMLFCCVAARWIAQHSRVNERKLLLLRSLFVGIRLAQTAGLHAARLVDQGLGALRAIQAAPGFYR